MKRENKFRVMMAIVVMFAVSINVEAQTGGLLDRAKKAVKQDTEKAVKQQKQSKPKSTASPSQSTTSPTSATPPTSTPSQSNETTTPKLKPSAEAIAADPRASVTTVEEGYTKSPAEIRAAYESLYAKSELQSNKANFFFPYYHPYLKKYYYLTDSKEELEFFSNAGRTLDAHRSKSRKWSRYYDLGNNIMATSRDNFEPNPEYVWDTIPAGNRTPWECFDDCIGIIPVGIHVIHAGYALFLADPEGLKPFMRLCEARNAANAYRGSINIEGGTDGRTLRTRSEKLTVPWKHAIDLDRFDGSEVYGVIRAQTPVSVIRDAATYYKNEVAKYDAANDIVNTRYYFHLFEVAMYYWKEYTDPKKREQLADDLEELFYEYKKYAGRYNEWYKASQLDIAPIDMPKTYTMNATLAAKALEVAKKQFENRSEDPFKVDKIVFLSDKWSEAREQAWPNRVVTRTIQVGVLTNMNGKWVIRQWTLQQDSDLKGGWVDTYRYVAGSNYEPKPVNYKP